MRHIRHINDSLQVVNEATRQLHTLYYISSRKLDGKRGLPYRIDTPGREMTPTYIMIQDAVREMDTRPQETWLYMLHAKISICTEAELVRYLISKGYDAEDVLYGLEAQHSLPEAMDRDDYNGLRWGYDALEIGDLVMCFDLASCVDTMSEVQDSIIERIRAKSK